MELVNSLKLWYLKRGDLLSVNKSYAEQLILDKINLPKVVVQSNLSLNKLPEPTYEEIKHLRIFTVTEVYKVLKKRKKVKFTYCGSVNRTVSTGFFGVMTEPNAEKVKPFHTA